MSLSADSAARIALGTVQFGLKYGIANRSGRVSRETARSILERARCHGVGALDTAFSYGESESVLGEIGIADWSVVSKLPAVPGDCRDIDLWLNQSVETSLARLKIGALYGLLLHSPRQLLEANGDRLFTGLQGLKALGKVKKIGISIYDPTELDEICDRYEIDIVQAPLNILDNRIVDSGWMSRLFARGIELQVRSVFLQGLLLMNAGERPQKFARWKPLWDQFDAWLAKNDLTALQACLQHVLSFSQIDKVILGVETLQQLDEILALDADSTGETACDLSSNDIDLINPSRWSSL